MQVMVVHHTPTLTRERYEQVVKGLSGKDRLESPSDVPTPGLLVHAAAEADDGFIVFDVFESQEAFDQFRATASPIATEAGIESAAAARVCASNRTLPLTENDIELRNDA